MHCRRHLLIASLSAFDPKRSLFPDRTDIERWSNWWVTSDRAIGGNLMLRTFARSTALAIALIGHASAQQITEQQAYEIAKDAYVYAYPLVLEYVTKIQGTNY